MPQLHREIEKGRQVICLSVVSKHYCLFEIHSGLCPRQKERVRDRFGTTEGERRDRKREMVSVIVKPVSQAAQASEERAESSVS